MSAAVNEPDPTPGDAVVLDEVLKRISHEGVIKDLRVRAEMGKAKYNTYLMTNNGRDAIQDAYQEALDLIMYVTQADMEGTSMSSHLFSGVMLVCIQLNIMLDTPKKPEAVEVEMEEIFPTPTDSSW
jgi:hypothetical protein